VNLSEHCGEQNGWDDPVVPNTENTFLMEPLPQLKHLLPLESSPTSCRRWVLSPQVAHSYSYTGISSPI
jgi:hypothetical protein